ncbi:uncharacterized protein RJT21DRAFT_85714 [Scheffersomyces amazonensis]|uniref:uncharacterized protein n=1 Tax=Scheffersomyces amazonensis TaxID=1078765 RepID=UPI00315C96FE
MIYETTINPGEGLGNYIKLGASMYTIMKYLDKFNYKLRISYSNTDFLNVPILVNVVDLGIRLTFSNHKDQLLELIEISDFNNKQGRNGSRKLLKLVYNGISLNEIESNSNNTSNNNNTASSNSLSSNSTLHTLLSKGPNLKSIYNKIFGPTYPGVFNRDTGSYILSYPGISFKFVITNEELINKTHGQGDDQVLSILLNWDDNSDIICSSIALHKGKSWSQFKLKKDSSVYSETSSQSNVQTVSGLKFYLDEGKIVVDVKGYKGDVNKTKSFDILLSKTTQQEILNILGPPDDYFNKFDSRLLIHKHLSNNEEDHELDNTALDSDTDLSHFKFHNYFKYGIDILYDLNNGNSSSSGMSATVKKVIAHNGGLTESLNFMKWNRCSWEISTKNNDEEIKIDSSMYFKDLPIQFRSLTPVLLNRHESEYIDNELDIIDFPTTNQEEVKKEEDTEFGMKVKTWGQSKLYGYERCIIEVINSNGCISSVTVY